MVTGVVVFKNGGDGLFDILHVALQGWKWER